MLSMLMPMMLILSPYKWCGIAQQFYIGHRNGNGMNLSCMWLCFEYEKMFIVRLRNRINIYQFQKLKIHCYNVICLFELISEELFIIEKLCIISLINVSSFDYITTHMKSWPNILGQLLQLIIKIQIAQINIVNT